MDEVSAVFRIVREVCDLWDDPLAWRQHLLRGACRLVDGHVGMMLADYQPGHGFFGNLEVISVVGLMNCTLQPFLIYTVSLFLKPCLLSNARKARVMICSKSDFFMGSLSGDERIKKLT